jgi:UDP-N-acetyl-D-glucosamine dehydrogenase
MDINIHEVIDAAKTKPFGFQAFYPGPGLGGHCIPIDPFYLTWKAREYDFHTRFIELAGEINTNMPYYVVEKTIEALNRQKKSISASKILVLGLAYKKDIDDTRESPSLKLIELMQEKGAHVDFNDPYIPRTKKMRMYDLKRARSRLRGKPQALRLCGHSDRPLLLRLSVHPRPRLLVVDTRNATNGSHKNGRCEIVKA